MHSGKEWWQPTEERELVLMGEGRERGEAAATQRESVAPQEAGPCPGQGCGKQVTAPSAKPTHGCQHPAARGRQTCSSRVHAHPSAYGSPPGSAGTGNKHRSPHTPTTAPACVSRT